MPLEIKSLVRDSVLPCSVSGPWCACRRIVPSRSHSNMLRMPCKHPQGVLAWQHAYRLLRKTNLDEREIVLSEFDVDLLAVEDVTDGEVEEDEIDGIGQRSPFVGRDDSMDAVIDPSGNAEVA